MKKKIVLFFSLVLIFLIAWNFQLISYGVSQLKGQLHIIPRPVSEILDDIAIPDSVKARLNFIQRIRTFAIDSLGLNESKNYTTFFDQQEKPLLMVLTASDRFMIRPYLWHFPFLGNVPYKGFFNFKKGSEEELELKSKGYDTDYGEVSAWSTLGWFRDPVLSGMLYRSDGQLAELIIHELTHSTLYVKDDVDFNENLASFIGEQGAIRFLQSANGSASQKYITYVDRLSDYNLFSRFMVTSTARLDSMYQSIAKLGDIEKQKRKDSAFHALSRQLDSLPFKNPNRFSGILNGRKANNAYLLNFVRYDSQKDSLNNLFVNKFQNGFHRFLQAMKKTYGK
jgi:predicted aminopeptidase